MSEIKSGAQSQLYALDGLVTALGATAKYRLAKAVFDPNANLALADFTEADFTGYTAGGISPGAMNGPLFDPIDGRPYVFGDAGPFVVGAGPVTPNTIYGWYLVDTAPVTPVALAWELFDNPILLDTTDQAIHIVPHIKNAGIDGPSAYED